MNIKTLKKDSKDAFSYLAGINRSVSPGHVSKLAASVNTMGIIRPVVITTISFISGKSTKYIVDGQHLFNALIRNNMDIPYVEIQVKDTKDLIEKIALLNASSKSWKLLDYITAWAAINKDYKQLNHLFQVYDFELALLASICMNKTSDITRNIKNGSFTIKDENACIKLLDNLTDTFKVVNRMNRSENRMWCNEYTKFFYHNQSIYNHKVFMNKLAKNKEKLLFVTNDNNKVYQLLEKML